MEAILIVMTILIAILFFLLIRQKMTLEKLLEQQISLSENLAEVKKQADDKDEVISDAVRQQIEEEKDQIFSKWVQNILTYDPYNTKE